MWGLLILAGLHTVLAQPLSDAVLAYVEGDLERAGDRLVEHLAVHGHDPAARKLLAAIHLRREQVHRAIEILSSESWEPADDPQRDALLGSALLRAGSDPDGFELLERAAEHADLADPDDLVRLVLGFDTEPVMVLELDTDLIRLDLLEVLRLLDLGHHEQAGALLAGYLEQRPEHVEYLYLLGLSYLDRRDYRHARLALRRVLELDAGLTSARLALARLALIEQRWSEASRLAQEVLTSRPGQWDALLILSEVLVMTGRDEQALSWLEQAWHRQTTEALGQLLVDTLLRMGRPEVALAYARDLVDRFPGHPENLRSLGLTLLANDDSTAAVHILEQLVELVQDDAGAWQLLATAELQTQDFVAAMSALERAIGLAPDDLAVRLIQAEIYLLSERYDEALSGTREIQQRAPDQAVGFKLEGDIHMQRHDHAAAEQAYRLAFEKSASAQTALLLNSVRWLLGEHDAALSVLRRWLAILPSDTVVRLQLAMQLQQLDRAEEAIAEYERILEDQPHHVIALNNLAWLYLSRDPERSVALAESALEQAPERHEIADTLGQALTMTGEIARARLVLQQAAIQAPQIARIRYHLAVVEAELDDSGNALALLDELRTEDLESELREQVERLYRQLSRQAAR
jgi:putative PEP-CTERM system TPR-repeat lipoprotein